MPPEVPIPALDASRCAISRVAPLLFCAACGAAPPEPACNGSAALCARRYDEVAQPGAHNAMASEEEGFDLANQTYSMARALEDGVRVLLLDTMHDVEGVPSLCHGLCALGSKPLVQGAWEIAAFLAAHPHEVVTLVLETGIDAAETEAAFSAGGLLAFAHVQVRGVPWPTMQEMIASGRRLVVFTDRDGGAFPWYLPVWDHVRETRWHYRSGEDMDCGPNRGSESNPLFLVNHFVTDPVAKIEFAREVNADPFLSDRLRRCAAERGHMASFVVVDFYEVGDLFAAVRTLNGVGP